MNDFYIEYTEFLHKSTIVWEGAKKNNDYNVFKPYLEKVIEYLPIQRGGGTGPMKPGNQHMHGANTCDIFAMMGFNVDH